MFCKGKFFGSKLWRGSTRSLNWVGYSFVFRDDYRDCSMENYKERVVPFFSRASFVVHIEGFKY